MRIALATTIALCLACSGFDGGLQQAQIETTQMRLLNAGQDLDMHVMLNGKYPDDLSAVTESNTDAWDRPFELVRPGPNGDPYDLVSYGRDGQPGGSGADADLLLSAL